MEYIGNMGAFARNYSINCSFTNSWKSIHIIPYSIPNVNIPAFKTKNAIIYCQCR